MKQLLILCLLLTSCVEREEYEISISEKFNEKHTEIIIQAIEDWESACGIYVQVYVEDTSFLSTNVIYPAQGFNLLGNSGIHYPGINKIAIYIDPIRTDGRFYNVVTHELGHWIGGMHTEDSRDIMYWTGNVDDDKKTITMNDVTSVCSWR